MVSYQHSTVGIARCTLPSSAHDLSQRWRHTQLRRALLSPSATPILSYPNTLPHNFYDHPFVTTHQCIFCLGVCTLPNMNLHAARRGGGSGFLRAVLASDLLLVYCLLLFAPEHVTIITYPWPHGKIATAVCHPHVPLGQDFVFMSSFGFDHLAKRDVFVATHASGACKVVQQKSCVQALFEEDKIACAVVLYFVRSSV